MKKYHRFSFRFPWTAFWNSQNDGGHDIHDDYKTDIAILQKHYEFECK